MEVTAEMLERVKQRILSSAEQPDRIIVSFTRYGRIERLARDNPNMELGELLRLSYQPYKDDEGRQPKEVEESDN